MKLLVYTDLQATEGKDRSNLDPAMPLQRLRVRQFFEFLFRTYKEEACDGLVDLGDTTDDRSFIYRATLDTLLEGLARFQPNKHGIKLTGNHEQLMKRQDESSRQLFLPYFGSVDPGVSLMQNYSIVCAPYREDYDKANEMLTTSIREIGLDKPRLLLAHGDVRGVRYDSGETVKNGLDPKLFEKFDLVLLGHIHRHQKIGKNSWYVGSPFQQDFSETGQQKFIALVDIKNTITVRWIEVPAMPEYRVVDLAGFLSVANLKEEHRYNVVLHSIEQTATFYASPLAILGTPKLTYTAALGDTTKAEIQQLDVNQLLIRYTKQRPIAGIPADVATDLVGIGEMFLK